MSSKLIPESCMKNPGIILSQDLAYALPGMPACVNPAGYSGI